MSAVRTRLLWALATVALAAATSYLVGRRVPAERDFHRWMHDQLHLSAEQHAALEPLEQAFEAESVRLKVEIAAAGRALADAVRRGQRGAPEIEAALARLSAAQSALQRATLDHFFEMKDHLDPDQAEQLLQWTHDSLLPD
jgi:Spy/CpxP family protein refolding chaperone